MKKTKGFVKSSYIIRHSKNQLGNTLIPVIIALAISAVASVAFLKQGTDISDKAKVLEAQYEIANLLQYWNTIKRTKPINQITINDFPRWVTTRPNLVGVEGSPDTVLGQLGLGFSLGFLPVTSTSEGNTTTDYFTIQYFLQGHQREECLALAAMFGPHMEGISDQQHPSPRNINSGNPSCLVTLTPIFIIRLE